MIPQIIVRHRSRFAFGAAACLCAATAATAASAAYLQHPQHRRSHRAAVHHAPRKPAPIVPALHIMDFMHQSRSAIERHTGHAFHTAPDQVNENGYFCHYRVHGNEYVVEYQARKATSIDLIYGATVRSPDAALRAAGIAVIDHKPAVASRINRVWKGNLSPSGVRFLAVGRTSEGWNEVQILDDENP